MLNLNELNAKMGKLQGWALEMNAIVKDFNFNNFKEAIDFVNSVGRIAEEEKHHPTILIDQGLVHLMLTTHDEHGLTDKDFIVAEKIDLIGK